MRNTSRSLLTIVGAADHSSPLSQETFYRRPKIMTRTKCKNLASMRQYIARDGITYSISKNVRKEINYFARGSAMAYTGFHGSRISCTRGKLKVDGSDIYNMVMYMTEEILYHSEKFILRDDDDGVIAHFDNVQLSGPIEDSHCVGGDVTYVWRVPLTKHCPLHHVRNFKGQMIKYELPGLTIKAHKVVMSTDNSHVSFVIKGNKAECGQLFLTTNYPDLLIRSTIVEKVPDHDLITRELPKDELKLSNFITNQDDFIYYEISRNLRREFASVLHDECRRESLQDKDRTLSGLPDAWFPHLSAWRIQLLDRIR